MAHIHTYTNHMHTQDKHDYLLMRILAQTWLQLCTHAEAPKEMHKHFKAEQGGRKCACVPSCVCVLVFAPYKGNVRKCIGPSGCSFSPWPYFL